MIATAPPSALRKTPQLRPILKSWGENAPTFRPLISDPGELRFLWKLLLDFRFIFRDLCCLTKTCWKTEKREAAHPNGWPDLQTGPAIDRIGQISAASLFAPRSLPAFWRNKAVSKSVVIDDLDRIISLSKRSSQPFDRAVYGQLVRVFAVQIFQLLTDVAISSDTGARLPEDIHNLRALPVGMRHSILDSHE